LHSNPYDGHTPATDVAAMTGFAVQRTRVDKGDRGHNHPDRFQVWISGQVRRTTAALKREMKRRAATEPVIGHLEAEHRMGRNHLKGHEGDCINAVLAAVGYNFSLLLRWLAALMCALVLILAGDSPSPRHT
jgi:transposase, IS5 family